jgi:hypothetical protein
MPWPIACWHVFLGLFGSYLDWIWDCWLEDLYAIIETKGTDLQFWKKDWTAIVFKTKRLKRKLKTILRTEMEKKKD